jgi:hypothetical protein
MQLGHLSLPSQLLCITEYTISLDFGKHAMLAHHNRLRDVLDEMNQFSEKLRQSDSPDTGLKRETASP